MAGLAAVVLVGDGVAPAVRSALGVPDHVPLHKRRKKEENVSVLNRM